MIRPDEFFAYRSGEMFCEDLPVSQLALEYGTPCYVYSTQAILKPFERLASALTGLESRIHFAVKANSNLAILRLLHQAGAGMDVVSGGELARSVRAGAVGADIVFSGVGKSAEEMKAALAVGIYSFNVESVSELKLLDQVARQAGKIARVALRFNPDVNAKTHPSISTGLKTNKFGMPKKDCVESAMLARGLAGVSLLGISCHIGSQIFDLKVLEAAFTRTVKMAGEVGKILGRPLEFIDLGGGIGVSYRGEKTFSLDAYGRAIKEAIAGLPRRPKILLEPGRLLCGNAGVLVSRVLHKKRQGTREFLIIDAAMNDLMRPALYDAFHEIRSVRRMTGRRQAMNIVGPICESTDSFATNRLMPSRLAAGDLVAILSAGAYGSSLANNYNTRPRGAEVLVNGSSHQVIRRRETIDDLLRAELTRTTPGENL